MRFAGVDAFDDFFDGLVFDQEVADFYRGEDLTDEVGGGDFYAIEADAVGEFVHLIDFEAVAGEGIEADRLRAIFQGEFDLLGAEELLFELGEMAVVEDFAVVNDHDAAAEFFDVVEIVGGKEDGGAKFAIDGAQKMADVIFGDDVEADGGLVEKEEWRIVQERGGEIAAHAFA